MRRRNPHIPLRTPIYIGCEGESEVGYVKFLSLLAEDAGRHVYLRCEKLRGAGDPRSRILHASRWIKKYARVREKFTHHFILMDSDQLSGSGESEGELSALAASHKIALVWQRPCHEAFLLRHFADIPQSSLPHSSDAKKRLISIWPQYRKGMSSADLARRLNVEAVLHAAKFESELAGLLAAIGLVRKP